MDALVIATPDNTSIVSDETLSKVQTVFHLGNGSKYIQQKMSTSFYDIVRLNKITNDNYCLSVKLKNDACKYIDDYM